MIVDLCNLPVRSDLERAADWELTLRVRGVELAVRPQSNLDILELARSKARSIEETRKLVDAILFTPSPLLLESDEITQVVAAVVIYAGELVKKKQEEMVAAVATRVRTALAEVAESKGSGN